MDRISDVFEKIKKRESFFVVVVLCFFLFFLFMYLFIYLFIDHLKLRYDLYMF